MEKLYHSSCVLHMESELALTAIRDHDWPGNGRELRSRLLRAMDVATGDWVYPAEVFPELNQEDTGM